MEAGTLVLQYISVAPRQKVYSRFIFW